MEGGWECIKTVCVCVRARALAVCVYMRVLGTASFHGGVCVCVKGREGSTEGLGDSFVLPATALSAHTALVACKINTSLYLHKARLSALY